MIVAPYAVPRLTRTAPAYERALTRLALEKQRGYIWRAHIASITGARSLRYRATMLKPGDKTPAVALSDQHGKNVKLAGFKGRKVLVYFYP